MKVTFWNTILLAKNRNQSAKMVTSESPKQFDGKSFTFDLRLIKCPATGLYILTQVNRTNPCKDNIMYITLYTYIVYIFGLYNL